MKKLIVIICLLITCKATFAQTCEQKQAKLTEAVGSFSAGMLYNTYGVIGSLSDGYIKEAYNDESATSLLESQKKVIDNLVGVFNDLKNGGFVADSNDLVYLTTANNIFNGLKKQAQLMQDYIKSKTTATQTAYEQVRKQNWKDIAKLMGIKE